MKSVNGAVGTTSGITGSGRWGEASMDEEDIKQSKSPEPSAEKWALKDGLIAIPFIASALALTWEVGFFLRIKGRGIWIF